MTRLRWLLPTKAPGDVAAFYAELLGTAPASGTAKVKRFDATGPVELVASDGMPELETDRPHLAIEVDALEAALEKLVTAGATISSPPQVTALGRAARIRAPDGRALVVYESHAQHDENR